MLKSIITFSIIPVETKFKFIFFSKSKKYQVHRKHQINGALMHIKNIFDEFKQSKSKNIYLIKELHLNCLIYLPNVRPVTLLFQKFIFVLLRHLSHVARTDPGSNN